MKTLIFGLSLVALLVATGCEEEHEHGHHGPYGGAYDNTYGGYGYGHDYWEHHDNPYQGYPNYNGGYHY